MEIADYKSIQHWAEDLDGVFSVQDLKVIFKDRSDSAAFRALDFLVSSGELVRVKRGIYATPSASLTAVVNRIYPESYISTGTVLSQSAIIGSIPARRVQAVKTGSPRLFSCDLGTIEYLSIDPKLFFGFERKSDGLWATPAKAFLDVCYFYYKGRSFSFNPQSDINSELLDFDLVESYLKAYDQRFVTYFRRNWS